jgi:hypothetical protein
LLFPGVRKLSTDENLFTHLAVGEDANRKMAVVAGIPTGHFYNLTTLKL